MALTATVEFDVRTTGNDANGGGFDTASGGTDRSQQNSPQVAIDNATITTTVTTNVITFTGGTYTVLAGDVGNLVQITGGTNTTAGQVVQITSVGAGLNGTWTVDSNIPSSGTTANMTANMGGSLVSPGFAASKMVAGNTMHVKAGTYTITSASTNVAGGCVSLPASTSSASTWMVGYNATHRDDGTRPLLQAGSISTFTVVGQAGAIAFVRNISVDCAVKTASRAFASVACYLCKATQCTNSAYATCCCNLCEATSCSSSAPFSAGSCSFCVADSNTFTAFSNVQAMFCIAANNSGGTTDGFSGNGTIAITGCISYNNGRDGFRLTAAGTTVTKLINCIAYSNAASNFNGSAANSTNIQLYNCAAGAVGTGGNFNNLQTNSQFGNITLSASPFTNQAGGDFSLNNTAGGGASCRAAGMNFSPTNITGLSTTSFADVGAVQHQDSASGGGMSSVSVTNAFLA